MNGDWQLFFFLLFLCFFVSLATVDYLPLIAGFVAVAVVITSVIFVFIYSIYYTNTKMGRYSLKDAKPNTQKGDVAQNGLDSTLPMKKLSQQNIYVLGVTPWLSLWGTASLMQSRLNPDLSPMGRFMWTGESCSMGPQPGSQAQALSESAQSLFGLAALLCWCQQTVTLSGEWQCHSFLFFLPQDAHTRFQCILEFLVYWKKP